MNHFGSRRAACGEQAIAGAGRAPLRDRGAERAGAEVNADRLSGLLARAKPAARLGGGPAPVDRPKQQPLIEPADAEQHDAEPDEGQRLVDAGEIRQVDEEHLEHGEERDGRRGETHRPRVQPYAGGEQRHPEGEPDRRIGVLLGIAGLAGGQIRAMIEPRHLQREIGERERDRRDGRGYAIGARPYRARDQRQHGGEHRRDAVAEQDEIEERAADRLAGRERVVDEANPSTMAASASAALASAPRSCTTLRVRRRRRSRPIASASQTHTCSASSASPALCR